MMGLGMPGMSQRSETKAQPWLITFADLLSLMLTFFVLLFSMNEVKVEAWQPVVDALAVRFDPLSPKVTSSAQQPKTVPRVLIANAIDLRYLRAVLDEKLSVEGGDAKWTLTQLDDRIVISLQGPVLFASESIEMTESGRRVAGELSALLGTIRNRIEVSAHLAPPAGNQTQSDGWTVSLQRAAAFAQALQAAGYDRRVGAIGYADSRYREGLAERIDVAILQPS